MLLSGEAGIGKSRLTATLLERLAAEPHTRLRYFCSPQRTDSAFFPIIRQMERAAGLAHDDTAQAKLDKLDAVLAQSFTPSQSAALFAELLSLPNDGRYPTVNLVPRQRRQRTLEALTTQLEALARERPVVMIFEDVHWIDPTSLEALGRAVDRIRTLGVLLIVTYRPEFEPPWIGRPYVTPLTINRLGEQEIAAMIDRVAGNKPLPASIQRDIIERTDGIPLFVEEMTKAVLEAESEGAERQTAAAVPFLALAVPASLHASLMARLDRLGPAKDVAQIGAAIGREFSHALLAAVVRKPETELGAALDRLTQAGLLFRQGVPPHATYLFKHALVQDTAYGTLLRKSRRALHACIAETLESQFTEVAENQPELLARHCTEAGLIEMAAGLWGKAGQRSLGRSALMEAVAQFTRALDQIAALPATPALRQEQIKFQVALANTVMNVKGYAAPDARAALEQARAYIEEIQALEEPLEDPSLFFSVLSGFWAASLNAFNGDVMCELAAQYLALAERQGGTVPRMVGHRLMGQSFVCTGDIEQGRAHLDRAIALYDPAQHRPVTTQFAQDPRVASLIYRSFALWFLGYPEAALADADQALSTAREIGQAATLLIALNHLAVVYLLCGDYAKSSALNDEQFALADEKGAWYWKMFGMLGRGHVPALTGDTSDAIRMLTTAIKAVRSAGGATVTMPINLSFLALAYASAGNFDDACHCIGEAVPMIETTNERWFEAEVNRIAGEIALKSPEPDATRQRRISTARSRLRVHSKQNPGNSAPP